MHRQRGDSPQRPTGDTAGTLRPSQRHLPRGVAGARGDLGRNREPFGTENGRKDLSDQFRPQMAGGISARGRPDYT